ncbi:MAG: hypothetical protein AABY73_06960 [Pseudomonadota bacterium]
MKLKIVCGIILALGSMNAAALTFEVPAELWLAPRSGQAVRDNAQLSKAFAVYFQLAQPRVRLHHHKRDESSAQAEELRGWLIALGIEASRIELVEDSPTDQLTLDITDSR